MEYRSVTDNRVPKSKPAIPFNPVPWSDHIRAHSAVMNTVRTSMAVTPGAASITAKSHDHPGSLDERPV